MYTWTEGLWEIGKLKGIVETGLDRLSGKAASQKRWPWTSACSVGHSAHQPLQHKMLSQPGSLLSSPEHCSCSLDFPAALSPSAGQWKNSNKSALGTVAASTPFLSRDYA